MNQTQSGIVKALAYADCFDFALTLSEIQLRYQGNRKISQKSLKQNLDQLIAQKVIFTHNQYYFLSGRNHLAAIRKQRLRISTEKLVRSQPIIKKVSKIPGVKAIFLTGTVAADNAAELDDIDIMIITKSNMLWLTRLGVTVVLEIMRVRRTPHDTNPNNKICANLYLEETHLAVPANNRNLYTAHEVILVKPLFDPDNIAARFQKSNQWIKQFLPNTSIPQLSSRSLRRSVTNKWLLFLESIAYTLQHLYMKQHMTREYVTSHVAYFHPQDIGAIILEKFNKNYKRYDSSL